MKEKSTNIASIKESTACAILNGDIAKVRDLFEQNKELINVNSILLEEYSDTALLRAVACGTIDIVKYLLDQDAEIYIKDKSENNPLHKIVYHIKALGVDDKQSIDDGIEIFKLLLDHENKIRIKNPDLYKSQQLLRDEIDDVSGVPINILLITSELKERLRIIIEEYDVKTRHIGSMVQMAFYMAYHGRDSLLKELLSGMNLTELRSRNALGQTILHEAYSGFVQNIGPEFHLGSNNVTINNRNIHQIRDNYFEVFKAIIKRESELDAEYYEKGLRTITDNDGKRAVEIIEKSLVNINHPYDRANKQVKEDRKQDRENLEKHLESIVKAKKDLEDMKERSDDHFFEKANKVYRTDIEGNNIAHMIGYFIDANRNDESVVNKGLKLLEIVLMYDVVLREREAIRNRYNESSIYAKNNSNRSVVNIVGEDIAKRLTYIYGKIEEELSTDRNERLGIRSIVDERIEELERSVTRIKQYVISEWGEGKEANRYLLKQCETLTIFNKLFKFYDKSNDEYMNDLIRLQNLCKEIEEIKEEYSKDISVTKLNALKGKVEKFIEDIADKKEEIEEELEEKIGEFRLIVTEAEKAIDRLQPIEETDQQHIVIATRTGLSKRIVNNSRISEDVPVSEFIKKKNISPETIREEKERSKSFHNQNHSGCMIS